MLGDEDVEFQSWEEQIICQEKGNRTVHYYMKIYPSGEMVLAVRGYERSPRHMMYVVVDEFLHMYGSKTSITAEQKWRAKREVVDWLNSLLSDPSPLERSKGFSTGGLNLRTRQQDQIQVRKFEVEPSEIEWSDDPWVCYKQLIHYSAFQRNGIIIAVHSFVFIKAEEGSDYLGYLEDLYEDKKGNKRVRVRWFLQSEEVKAVIPELNPHPREVFITPQVQVISVQCIAGPATVLTPKHFENCLHGGDAHICFRQLKNNNVESFSVSKLSGYLNQSILASLVTGAMSKQKTKGCSSMGEEEKEFILDGSKRNETSEKTPKKLKIKLKSRGPLDTTVAGSEPQREEAHFKVNEEIEVLCQDSGIRGCWFRCKVLKISQQKRLKVRYNDLTAVDGPGKLEEWLPACRVANPDKMGMRIPGRFTVRPRPPKDLSESFSYKVGDAVDAWWSDGWWESVVTGIGASGTDRFNVYSPGEGRMLTLFRKDMRPSKDWYGNKWVNIQPKSDILSLLASMKKQTPGVKLPMCSNSGSSSALELQQVEEGAQKVQDFVSMKKQTPDKKFPICSNLANSSGLKLKQVEEDARKVQGSTTAPSEAENAQILNLEKRLPCNFEKMKF